MNSWLALGTGLMGLALSAFATGAAAQPREPAPTPKPSPAPESRLSLSAIVETYFSWNFNRPADGVTAFRGFDARHNTFALSNAVLDARWSEGAVSGRLAVQTGDMPDIYYGAEASGDIRHVMEATIAWRAPVRRSLIFDAGIFPSPIGPEGLLVRDNWNWSRSTLFFALPFYHAGLRGTVGVTPHGTVSVGLFNGWNNVTDTNGRKSVAIQTLLSRPNGITASLLYFGGVERPRGSADQPWRHLFDAHITTSVAPRLSLQAHADAGFEDGARGRAGWKSGALSLRWTAYPWLFVAGRADVLHETPTRTLEGRPDFLFFPTRRIGSLTATLEARPAERLSVRLEGRRDRADDGIFLKGTGDLSTRTRNTLTFGVTGWF